MSERVIMSEEKLTDSKRIGCCMECGEETYLVWLESFAFCSVDCLVKFTAEWAREMEEEIDRCAKLEEVKR